MVGTLSGDATPLGDYVAAFNVGSAKGSTLRSTVLERPVTPRDPSSSVSECELGGERVTLGVQHRHGA